MKNLIVVAGALALAGVAAVLVGMTQPHAAETGSVNADPPAGAAPGSDYGKLVRIPVPAREKAVGPTRPVVPEASRSDRDSNRE